MRFVLPSNQQQQARLAQSVARETLNLKVVGSSPTSGLPFCLESIAFALHVVEISMDEFLLVAVRWRSVHASDQVPRHASTRGSCLPIASRFPS